MENLEGGSIHQDQFYKQPVRLNEGIEVSDLLEGKSVLFEIKEDDSLAEPQPKMTWRNNDENNDTAINPDMHIGGSFTGLDDKFSENLMEDGGVRKCLISKGMGKTCPLESWVKIHYSYYAEGCDEPVDSTRLRGRPQDFILGTGEVLPGLDIAVHSMKKGEKSKFLVKPEYAYGSMGVPPRIPPKATLLFDVEVICFIEVQLANEYDKMSKDDRNDIPMDKILIIASTLREKGNEASRTKKGRPAFNAYTKALRILEQHSPADEAAEELLQAEQIKVLLNLAKITVDMGRTNDAREHCRQAIQFLGNATNKDNLKLAKAHYIMYKTFLKDSKLQLAKESLKKAASNAPQDSTIREAFLKLEKEQLREDACEKRSAEKVVKGLGWANKDGEESQK